MRVAMLAQPRDLVLAPGAGGGSVGIVASELAHHLAQQVDVTVFTRRGRGQAPRETVAGGVVHERVPVDLEKIPHLIIEMLEPGIDRGWLPLPYVASPLYYRGFVREIAKRLAEEPPELIHVHNFSQFLAPLRAACPRAKLILHMHCDWLSEFERVRIADRLRHVDLILAPSLSTAERICQRFPEMAAHVSVLPNGVDISPAPIPGQRPAGDRNRLLFVGRLSPEKGLHVLLGALERLQTRRRDWELVLCGAPGRLPFNYLIGTSSDPVVRALARFYPRGPRALLEGLLDRGGRRYAEELIRRHAASLGDRLRVEGPKPHGDIAKAYADADLLVFPSVCHEAFGMPLAEAMAAGLPTVTTEAGGITDLVEPIGAGVQVPRDDPEALAAAIDRLLDAPDLRREMGKRGRAFARAELSWAHVKDQLLDHYRSLLAGA